MYWSNRFMHNNSNTRNKQMEINTWKILPIFKIFGREWEWGGVGISGKGKLDFEI